MRCEAALSKFAVVATSDSLRKDMAKAMAQMQGMGHCFVRKSRITKLQRRKRRLAAVRKGGTDMQRLYLGGLQQSGYYGAEVVGLDAREVAPAQIFFLQTLGSACPS
eukprot:9117880-Pyramimonas_sp.AAC.1